MQARLALVVLLAHPACGTFPSPTPVPPDPPPPPPPPAGQVCDPALNPAMVAPLNYESDWVYAPDQNPYKRLPVTLAIQRAQASCPEMWREPGPSGCLADGPAGIDRGYNLISWHLQQAGIKASQAATPDRLYDHLYVYDGGKRWESWKLFEYGRGCLTGNPFKGGYDYIGVAAPAPTPKPPSTSGCSSPLPPKVWTVETLPDGWGQDQIGRPRWEIGCVSHGNVIDCTARVAPRACAYCESIGMGEIGGQPRCGCPVRSECPGFKCEERSACEEYLTGGTRLESRGGATCEFARGNPYQFWPSGGRCRLVSVADPRVYSEWF